MGGFCLLVKLHREWSAPAACAAGLFNSIIVTDVPFKALIATTVVLSYATATVYQ